MSEKPELLIDTVDTEDEDCLFLTPNHIKGVRFCALNTFDYATIRNCPTEKLNSGSLIGIFNSLKPGGEIYIEVNQPISVMLEYDSKQIDANLRLVGFENIEYAEKNIPDKKNGINLLVGTLTATKPLNKQNNIQIEIAKTQKNYTYKNERKRDRDFDRDNEDRGGYRFHKKVEKVEETTEEPNRYKKGRYTYNKSYNSEKGEREESKDNLKKKYNRFSRREEEEPKTNVYQKEERVERPKRYGYSKYEVKEGGPNEVSTTTKEVIIERTTVVDKSSDIENKKAGLRKRYGKH